ncbi:hypothetical protein ERO13_D04G091732v2 [Gossypium hirsutum]|nr:hypothetical protein ERO13_D04G091732v2 [Gossypium hirsutum]
MVIHYKLFEFAAFAAVSGNSLDTDKEVLLNLKSFLEEQNRVNRGRYTEWNERSSNPCEWYGILCSNGEARIIGMDLSDSNISGEMFNNFSALTHVQHLDLSTNTLNGVILDELNRCHNLVYLNLSHNILGGELMLTGLTAICHKLVVANLSMNNFWGSTDYFDGCWNLQYLDLSSNNFSGNIWTGFATLIEFSVAENYFTGSVPASCFMENCTVQILDLSENKFQSEPSSNNLVTLNIWGNNFSRPIPLELGSISTLESLLLGNNRFSILISESLLNLKKLTSLDLSNNSFGGKVHEIFGRFTQLKSLTLHGNSYIDGILSSGIHKLTNMSQLDLSYNNFCGELPVEISLMLGLKFLILGYNQFKSDIPSVYGDLSHLQALDLSFNGLSGSIPPTFGNLISLLWLMLANNSLTDRRSQPMNTGPTECLVMKTCRSIKIGLLKGCDFFQICDRGSPVREYVGEVPSDTAKMQKFSVLDFSSNEFNGKLPAEMGKLPLIVLNISRNEFSGQILTKIGNIRCLKNLDSTGKLSTFGKDSFLGNPLLHRYGCGMVLGVAILYSIFRNGEPHWFATVVDGIHEWMAKQLLKRKLGGKSQL